MAKGREGGREVGRVGGREGGRVGGREGGREGGTTCPRKPAQLSDEVCCRQPVLKSQAVILQTAQS